MKTALVAKKRRAQNTVRPSVTLWLTLFAQTIPACLLYLQTVLNTQYSILNTQYLILNTQ